MTLSDTHLAAWRRLLERLQQPETREQWAMETFVGKTACGTVGCLAYHACLANGTTPKNEWRCEFKAFEILGLDDGHDDSWDHALYGRWVRNDAPGLTLEDITIDHAIRYVRKVVETRDPMVTIEVEE